MGCLIQITQCHNQSYQFSHISQIGSLTLAQPVQFEAFAFLLFLTAQIAPTLVSRVSPPMLRIISKHQIVGFENRLHDKREMSYSRGKFVFVWLPDRPPRAHTLPHTSSCVCLYACRAGGACEGGGGRKPLSCVHGVAPSRAAACPSLFPWNSNGRRRRRWRWRWQREGRGSWQIFPLPPPFHTRSQPNRPAFPSSPTFIERAPRAICRREREKLCLLESSITI